MNFKKKSNENCNYKHVPKAEGRKTENTAARETKMMKEEEAICNQVTWATFLLLFFRINVRNVRMMLLICI
jgi:hypothetical protein